MKDGIINIHGREYMTVAKRVQIAHEEEAFEKLETEVLAHTPVVVKATVTIKGKTYTGISAANPAKSIEKMSPYEVAETSAVGRALGFAGYGIIEGIASADEMVKAGATEEVSAEDTAVCPIHKVALKHFERDGKEWWSHRLENGQWCNGKPAKKVEDKDFDDITVEDVDNTINF